MKSIQDLLDPYLQIIYLNIYYILNKLFILGYFISKIYKYKL